MHDFHFIRKKLYCESVFLEDIAQKVGTPVYVYSKKTITDHVTKLKKAFSDVDHLICYSVKSCSNIRIIREVNSLGVGVDIVSGGELFRAIKAGVDPQKIVFAGVGKREDEIKNALDKGILFFTVESADELEQINIIAKKMNVKAPIALRVNPDVDPKTHTYISTGKIENKFGLDMESAFQTYEKAARMDGIAIVGLHMHIGSQLVDPQPYVEALRKVVPFVEKLKKAGISLKYLDIGGGMGIVYDKETPSTADNFASLVKPLISKLNVKIIIEPGRFIAGNSGVLLTRILYIKKNPVKTFVIVDAAMNDLIRPSLYGAFHKIEPVVKKDRAKIKIDIVGPICESGDFLAKDRFMQQVKKDELLSVMSAGAYGFTMSSNYNSRPRTAEVLVSGDSFEVVRERESYEDLIRGEKI